MKLSPYFVAITAFFVTALVVANVLAVKLVEIGDRVFPAGLVVFPRVPSGAQGDLARVRVQSARDRRDPDRDRASAGRVLHRTGGLRGDARDDLADLPRLARGLPRRRARERRGSHV
jgi:hypothetical protein